MTRPKKATADFFPHFAKSGKTIFILESRHGNDGYSAWFKILEQLTSAENHFIDCNNPADWEFLCAKTRLDGQILTEILDLLASLDAIEPEFWKIHVIRSENLVENLSELYARRVVKALNKTELMALLSTKYPLSGSNVCNLQTETPPSGSNVNKNPYSIVKERIGEESKGTGSVFDASDFLPSDPTPPNPKPKPEKKSFPIPESLQTDSFKNAWADWQQHRKEKRCKLTPKAIERQLSKLADMGEKRAVAAINHSITNGYQGIFEDNSKKQPQKGTWTTDLKNMDFTGGA